MHASKPSLSHAHKKFFLLLSLELNIFNSRKKQLFSQTSQQSPLLHIVSVWVELLITQLVQSHSYPIYPSWNLVVYQLIQDFINLIPRTVNSIMHLFSSRCFLPSRVRVPICFPCLLPVSPIGIPLKWITLCIWRTSWGATKAGFPSRVPYFFFKIILWALKTEK